MPDTGEEQAEAREAALIAARELAWRHFDFHAKQRVEVFKAYLTLVTIVYAGCGVSLQVKAYSIGLVLSAASVLFSIIFYLFDARSRQLVKISERFLITEESRLSRLIGNQAIRLFRKSDLATTVAKRGIRVTFSNLFSALFLSNAAISLLLFCTFLVYILS
jgi:hypothetical protein